MQDPVSPENVCPNCGLGKGRLGSFSYWIFKENRCQCESGDAPVSSGSRKYPGGKSKRSIEKKILNDRYELLDCVGQGATGVVYKATDLASGNLIALKLMSAGLSQNELAVKRLFKEVAVVSSISHSNLGQVHGYGQEKDGLPYLVMDFVEGKNLADLIVDEELNLDRVLDIFIQICAGLDCAHTNGIIHRDLKPSNVIIQKRKDGRDRAVIVDFGFAKLLQEDSESIRLTQEGEAFGTPAYMSPEQCLGEDMDVRSDIYSMGCLMYEVLTGTPPLVGENVLATVAKQVRDTPEKMRTLNKDIPVEMDSIVAKCLCKEPIKRYQNSSDLRNDLIKVTEGSYVATSLKQIRVRKRTRSGKSVSPTSESGMNTKKIVALVSLVVLVSGLVGGIAALGVWMVLKEQSGIKAVEKTTVNAEDKSAKDKPVAVPVKLETDSKAPNTEKPVQKKPVVPKKKPVRKTAPRSQRASKPAKASPPRQVSKPKANSSKQSTSSSWDRLKQLRKHK